MHLSLRKYRLLASQFFICLIFTSKVTRSLFFLLSLSVFSNANRSFIVQLLFLGSRPHSLLLPMGLCTKYYLSHIGFHWLLPLFPFSLIKNVFYHLTKIEASLDLSFPSLPNFLEEGFFFLLAPHPFEVLPLLSHSWFSNPSPLSFLATTVLLTTQNMAVFSASSFLLSDPFRYVTTWGIFLKL